MQAATVSSRSMRWGGLFILFFVLYHLLHFTTGDAHHHFVAGSVYCNMVTGFQIWWVSAIYIVAMVFLALHLDHGLWSMFQTLGINNPRWNAGLETFSRGVAAVIFLGNISMPIAALAGLLPTAGLC
jgi:succinate dehydrogenase / fumarate reductase cytochrome b subunit